MQFPPATTARNLLRSLDRASLATMMAEKTGMSPYASLVMLAVDYEAAPLLYLSDLAVHSINLKQNASCSLLLDGSIGMAIPLRGNRISVQGQAMPVKDETLLQRYINRHPDAEIYRSFSDFHLYRMEITHIHLVAGFGRIHRIEANDILYPAADAMELRACETDIIAHMNADHSDALNLYAAKLAGQKGVGWFMTGIDPEGIDLGRRAEKCRLNFEQPVGTADEARQALVSLAQKARYMHR